MKIFDSLKNPIFFTTIISLLFSVSDFSMVLPTSGDLILTATNTTDFNQYEVNILEARYVKLMGYGRFNSAGDSRTSVWSAVGEIESYGSTTVSIDKTETVNKTLIYPNPTKDILHFKNMNGVNLISIYDMDGRKIMDKKITSSSVEADFNVSAIANGFYILVLKGEQIFERRLFNILH